MKKAENDLLSAQFNPQLDCGIKFSQLIILYGKLPEKLGYSVIDVPILLMYKDQRPPFFLSYELKL